MACGRLRPAASARPSVAITVSPAPDVKHFARQGGLVFGAVGVKRAMPSSLRVTSRGVELQLLAQRLGALGQVGFVAPAAGHLAEFAFIGVSRVAPAYLLQSSPRVDQHRRRRRAPARPCGRRG